MIKNKKKIDWEVILLFILIILFFAFIAFVVISYLFLGEVAVAITGISIYIFPILLFFMIRSLVKTINRPTRLEYQEDFDLNQDEEERKVGTIFTPIRRFFSRRKHNEEIEESLNQTPTSGRVDRFGNLIPENSAEKTLLFAIEESEKPSFEHLIYSGKITLKEKCGICKLTFNIKENIFFCPFCKSLFHANHLKKWLETNETCPICSKILI